MWFYLSKKALHDSPPTASASAPWWESHEKIMILSLGERELRQGWEPLQGHRGMSDQPIPRVRQAQDTLLPWDWGGPAQIFSWSVFSLGHRGQEKCEGPFQPLPDRSSGPKHTHVRNPPSPEEQEGMSHGL